MAVTRNCPCCHLHGCAKVNSALRKRALYLNTATKGECGVVDRGFSEGQMGHVDDFVRHQNIARFRRLLAETTDENERRHLLRLLEEEEASGEEQMKMPRGMNFPD
jgi:hypothetical protein